ncbi:MAG: hypothetical protein K6G42_02985 [Lachnospiraceae bacterium]|nr:hypothetical protein [Lachnospiraceae bacterium]
MIEILNTIVPVILMLAIGVIARRSNLLSREGINALKSVVVNITLPAVMLNAFATMSYSFNNIIITALMFLVCLAALLMGKLFAGGSRFVPFLTTGFEAGMLGYSLFMLLYGSENISSFAYVDLGQVLFVFTVYKILLGNDGNKKAEPKQLVSEMFHSPTIIAIIAGVILGATGLYNALIPSGVSSLIDACTDFVSAPTGAVILITIGYDLVFSDIPWKAVCKVAAARIIIMVLLRVVAGLVVHAIGMGEMLDPALNIMFILPPPYVLPVFADDENQRNFVSSSLSVITLLSIIFFIILTVVAK